MKLPLISDRASALGHSLAAASLWACLLGGASVVGSGSALAHKAKPAPFATAPASEPNGPGSDFPVVLGDQYSIGSTTYTPADVMNYDAVGYVAVDGEGGGISAAHHTLPIPSYVEITSLTSGRTILVRVDRRGPMDSNRVISLSQGAAAQLGIGDHDTVRVRRVNPPEPERAALRAGASAPERMPTPQPLLAVLTRRLAPDEPVSLTSAAPPVLRPIVAPAYVAPPAVPTPRAVPAAPVVSSSNYSGQGRAVARAPAYAPQMAAPQAAPTPAPTPQAYAPQAYVPQTYAAPQTSAASDLAPMPPDAGASYVPSAQAYAPPARPAAAPARQYAPAPAYAPPAYAPPPEQAYAAPAQQYAPAPPVEQAVQPAEPAPAPVPFRSYLIRPLRRAPDGSVLMPGTDAPTYPTPAFPTADSGQRVDQNGAVYAYGPPTQPSAAPRPNMARPVEPPRSYLIQPMSRMGMGGAGGTVVQPETLSRSRQPHADAGHAQSSPKGHHAVKPDKAKPKKAKVAKQAKDDGSTAGKADADSIGMSSTKGGDADNSHKPAPKPAHPKGPHKPLPDETSLAAPAAPAPMAAFASATGETLVVQAGAYGVRGRAEQVAQAVGGVVSLSGRVWRVRCGPFASRGAAEAALAKAKAAGYSEARIQRAD